MRLEDVLKALGEEDCFEAVKPHWDESEACFPRELPSFLQPGQVRDNRKSNRLAEYMEPQILETAERIADDPNLLHLAWHCYRLVYEYPDFLAFGGFPSLEKSLGKELHGIFYLLVAMGIAPILRQLHLKKGVGEEITHNNLTQIRDFNWSHRKGDEGRLGVGPTGRLGWLKHQLKGELYRIGRMQYFIKPSFGHVEAYRNGRTGEVLALAEDGMKMADDGYASLKGEEDKAAWTTSHVTDYQAGTTTGSVITPRGKTLRQKVTLDLNEWDHVLGRGSLMLSMHIPGGGQMALKQCIESARDAFVFFQKIFPHRPVVGIDCISWIFGPQLEEMFGPEVNLVKLMREGYMYSVPWERNQGLSFIFYRNDDRIQEYPCNTDFQRQVLDWVLAGNTWRAGGWFVLKDDVERLGTQYYRSHFPPKGLDIIDDQ